MVANLSVYLLLFLFILINHANSLTFDEILNKKRCTSDLRSTRNECSTRFRQDMCAYFTGSPCDSEYCAMMSVNQCTACQDSSVQFYSSDACNHEKVYCDLENRPDKIYANLTNDGPVCAYYRRNCVLDICGIEVANSVTACSTPNILYYKPGKCEVRPEVLCDAGNRPSLQNTDLNKYEPVCAYYKEDCPLKVCGMEAINSDFACSLTQVLYYLPGKCDADAEIFSCDYTYCNTDKDFTEYKPVCGIRTNCQGSDCTQTFNNKCRACGSRTYSWYKNGICEEDRRRCNPDNRPTDCRNTAVRPVCAFFPNSFNELVFNTVENSCNACLDPNVKYYTSGACNLTKESPTYCLTGNRPKNCNQTSEPVCAFFDMTLSNERFTDMINPCAACNDSRVSYYEPGSCKISCRSEEMRKARPSSFNYSYTDPVCGLYTVNQQTYSVSLQNKYVACDNLVTPIDSYKLGLCSGDEGIRCENNALGLATGTILPVCGIFVEGCQNDTCRRTFAEPTVACEYSSAILYKPGLCPDDEGVSCDPYRPKAGEQLCLFNDLIYSQVCGYFIKGCQDSSCRMTFSTQCKACSVSSVIFFTAGACPDDE